MLNAKSLIQIECLWNEIRIEFVKFLIEKRCEILWKFIGLLETRPQSIGKSCNIRDMMIFTELWLVLNACLNVSDVTQHPPENRFLDLLVVFFFEEFIAKKLLRSDDEQFSSSRTHIKCSDRPICWETDWSTGQNWVTWLTCVDGSTVWIYEFETSIFVSVG